MACFSGGSKPSIQVDSVEDDEEFDYVIVGAGAAGFAFVDTLLKWWDGEEKPKVFQFFIRGVIVIL